MTQGRFRHWIGLLTVALSCALPAMACIMPPTPTPTNCSVVGPAIWRESASFAVTARTGSFTAPFVLDVPPVEEPYQLQPRAAVAWDNPQVRVDWLMDQMISAPALEYIRPLTNPAMALGQAALPTP